LGHALTAFFTPGAPTVDIVTITPRSKALGYTAFDNYTRSDLTKQQLLGRLAASLGGRAAEEIIFGPSNITTGASDDFKQATDLAQGMVTSLGMGEMGTVNFESKELSPETQQLIDQDVNKLLKEAYNRAIAILTEHKKDLYKLATILKQKETLTLAEIKQILEENKLVA